MPHGNRAVTTRTDHAMVGGGDSGYVIVLKKDRIICVELGVWKCVGVIFGVWSLELRWAW